MEFTVKEINPLSFFARLVQDDAHFVQMEAAASLAQDVYPRMDVQQVLHDIDTLAERLHRRLKDNASPVQRFQTLNQFLFNELRFSCKLNDPLSPSSIYIHHVLHLRRGAPISMAMIWMELAQDLGLRTRCIGGVLGHFMVKVHTSQGEFALDPISGRYMNMDGLVQNARMQAHASATTEEEAQTIANLYIREVTSRELIACMLRSLKEIHLANRNKHFALLAQERLVVLLPDVWEEYRERGRLYASMGKRQLALDDLQTYLQHRPDAADHAEISRLSDSLGLGG